MNQIIDEAYKNYENKIKLQNNWEVTLRVMDINTIGQQELLSQEEFINKCKTDPEFSERWGLKIEERKLSLEERHKIALPIWKEKYGLLADIMVPTNVDNTPYKIPTKLITITYKNETIESYE